MESPPSNRLIGCGGGAETTPRRRRYSRRVEAKSSPKTPIHPSNGYQVMEVVDSDPPSARMSPMGMKFGCKNDAKSEAENGGGGASCPINKHDAHGDASPDIKPSSDAPRSIDRPASQEEEPPVTVMVSQESETDATESLGDNSDASRSRENAGDGSSQFQPGRGPRQTRGAGGSARRRSLRLRSKAIEPSALETVPSPKPGGKAGGGNSRERGATDGSSSAATAGDDNNDAPNPAALRRSPRERGKSLGGSSAQPGNPPSVAAAKNPTKRKRRPSARGAAQNDVEGLSPVKRGCEEVEVALYSNHELDFDPMLSPKKLVLEGAPANPAKENLDFVWGEGGVDSTDTDVDIVLEIPHKPILEAKAGPVDGFAISMSEDGHAKLVEALEKIAFDVVIGPSNFANVSRRRSSGRRHKNKKRGRRSGKFALESPGPISVEEDVPGGLVLVGMERAKGRRDTFDLSKKRGLVSSAKRLEELNISIDRDASYDDGANPDYVTPKSGSAEVNIDAIVGEISRTLDDEPQRDGLQKGKAGVADGVEASAVENNLRHLTSIAIEDGMRRLFPHKLTKVYKYPCVSARIFAAMGAVYEDQEDFAPLLPFFLSLVEAEIVSLKKADEEENEPFFLNRKVCFSGFDYSSTTTVLGEVVGQGGGDLRPSIEALEAVLREALKLSRPVHCLDVAVRCLRCIASCEGASDACAKTMVGYFPSARFGKAFKHYLDEMEDVKRFLLSQRVRAGDRHVGVRYRLNDFVGRSVRYHMRELLNTLPESVVGFDVEDVEERWGRAVDDRSISSILNFALERIHELARAYPGIFEYGARPLPDFFASGASRDAPSWTLRVTRGMDRATYEALAADISEARAFLFGARATKFAMELLQCPGVEEHIHSLGGWAAVEAIAGTFHDLKLHEGSENEHFVQLREVRDLIFMLEDVDQKIGQKVEDCESAVRRLRRKFVNLKSNHRSYVYNLKVLLAAEKGEHFPVVVSMG